MSTRLTDLELKKQLVKTNTVRLAAELGRAQDVLLDDALEKLTRIDLISYIFHLCRISGNDIIGQSNVIKTLVANFDITKVVLLMDLEEAGAVHTPKAPAAQGAAFFNTDMARFLLDQAKERAEERTRQEEKERVAWEKKEEKDRQDQERLTAERERLEEKERVAQEKLDKEKAKERPSHA